MRRWILKALMQKTLASVPGGLALNYHLQGASRGDREKEARTRVEGLLQHIRVVERFHPVRDAVILELGTGWGAINAVLLSLLGAKVVIATDHLRHLRHKTFVDTLRGIRARADLVAEAAGRTETEILETIDRILGADDLDGMLRRASIDYRAPFDAGRTSLADSSVDIHYSFAVLAHVPEPRLRAIASEAARVLRKGGIAAHLIGLQDPYNTLNGGRKVNFLRYSERVWSFLSHNRIQYNNRVRASEHTANFVAAGGELLLQEGQMDDKDLTAIRAMSIHDRFAGLEERDLATTRLNLVLRF